MRLLPTRLVVLSCLMVAFASTALVHGQDLDPVGTRNKEKLLGTWEVTTPKGSLPKGTLIQFAKDGKAKITIRDATNTAVVEVRYTVSGSTIRTTYKDDAGKETKESLKIKKIGEKELITTDKEGKDHEFKRNK